MWRFAKQLVFGRGERAHAIWFGVGAGCRFLIDPANKTQRILGLDEAELGAAFRKAVAQCRTFIDVGASDGYYPIIALRLNSNLTAIGCEPQAHLGQHAWENYRLNFGAADPKMEWVSQGVGENNGDVALDTLTEGRAGPFLVKIDVDGGEVGVLRSGARLLARSDCTVLLEVHSQQLEADCIKLLESAGYQCRVIKNAWWRWLIPEHRPIGWNRWVLALPSTTNTSRSALPGSAVNSR
jgi:hypothetical protein